MHQSKGLGRQPSCRRLAATEHGALGLDMSRKAERSRTMIGKTIYIEPPSPLGDEKPGANGSHCSLQPVRLNVGRPVRLVILGAAAMIAILAFLRGLIQKWLWIRAERSAESSIARTLHRQNPFRFLERRVRQRTLLLCAQQPCRSLEKVSQRLSRDTVLGRGRNCVKRAPDRRRLLVFGIRLNMRAMRHRPGPGDGTISDIRCVSRCI